MSQSLKRVLLDYKKMLNTKNEKELFCAVLTHCDANIEIDGEPLILDENEQHCFGNFETFEERIGAQKIYEKHFQQDIDNYGAIIHNDLGLNYKLFKPISCIAKDKISKRDLRDFPFLPELATIVLDNFGDNLIDIL